MGTARGHGTAVEEMDQSEDDLALVAGLRARREDSVRTYLKRFRSLLHHCIGHFETDVASREDLFQELTWYVIERLDRGSYDPAKGSFGTWLYRVAWCRCVDLKRKQTARTRLQVAAPEEELPEQADPHPGPNELVGESEVGLLVRRALEELEPEERTLLDLRYVEGLVLTEIAKSREITVEQAKYRLKRASANLRRALLARVAREEVAE